ncbi:type II secretion system minor pseudopilin GspJ [Chitinimonas koreensis]|uniref:type II secretion system minor pseudopilin GspJ n=1 Tax=Chitinimonas koreensis TaxID=356302 RepID=UPI0004916DCA|nr:type II secretion system minor pseudopilin GspJ [Chitinimonas koreensis]QNM97701.1 type II secretion system minor pseudopilin GspJ [Chitinimonas koreensis]
MHAQRSRATLRGPAGFTLIEILIALAVFSVLAVIAYQGVARMATTKQVMDADNRKWRELTVALARFDEDFTQVANRPWRDEGGTTQAPVRGAAGAIDANGAQLELVRYDGGRLTHIGYRLREGRLELLLWNGLDLAPRSQPTALALLDHVAKLDLRFLDAAGQWQLSWPQGPEAGKPPRGVELVLTLQSGETVTRLYALP